MNVYFKWCCCQGVVLLNSHIEVCLWYNCFLDEPIYHFCVACCLWSGDIMSFNWRNTSHRGQNKDIGNFNDVNEDSWMRCIFMLQLLQMKGLFQGFAHKDHYDHIKNYVDVSGPLSFKNISQEWVQLRLFPFSLMGESTKWLPDLHRDSITT